MSSCIFLLTSEMPTPSKLIPSENVVTTSTSTASKVASRLLAVDDAVSMLRRCTFDIVAEDDCLCRSLGSYIDRDHGRLSVDRELEGNEGTNLEGIDEALAPTGGNHQLTTVLGREVPGVCLLRSRLKLVMPPRRTLPLGGFALLGLPEFDRLARVVAEEERPCAGFRIDPDEDGGSIEQRIDPREAFLAALREQPHVGLADVLQLERRGPPPAVGEREDELGFLSCAQEPDVVSLTGRHAHVVGGSQFANPQLFAKVVLDEETRTERDHLGELVLWRRVA
jgi:hypothetical protein